MMNRKYFIYIAVVIVLLIAWYYRVSIKNSIVHSANYVAETLDYVLNKLLNNVIKLSPFTW